MLASLWSGGKRLEARHHGQPATFGASHLGGERLSERLSSNVP